MIETCRNVCQILKTITSGKYIMFVASNPAGFEVVPALPISVTPFIRHTNPAH